MKTLYTVARILLGILFVVMGLNCLVTFLPPPPPNMMPPAAAQWNAVVFSTHYLYVVGAFQLLAGVLLLANRYVVFAIVVLAGILVNIFAFHITMWPATIVPLPVLALVLWFLTAWPVRRAFAPLFVATVSPESTRT